MNKDLKLFEIKKSNVESGENRGSSSRRWRVLRSPKSNLPESGSVTKLSHDIRTQLYIIIGFAELMLDEVPGKINDEQRRSLNDVLNSGKRLLDLLNDIVEPSKSRPGTGRIASRGT